MVDWKVDDKILLGVRSEKPKILFDARGEKPRILFDANDSYEKFYLAVIGLKNPYAFHVKIL